MTGTVLEGFAGPGGFSEAARMIGLPDPLGIEVNADACATATAAGHRRVQADIRTLDPEDFPHVTTWVSGPPCPTYSKSGKQSGLVDYRVVLEGLSRLGDAHGSLGSYDAYADTYARVADERTALVVETLRFALRLPNVRCIIAEQVPAVHDIWAEICAELAAAADWESCNVVRLRYSDFGVATRRERVFLIATRDYTPDFTGMPIRARWSCGRFEPPRLHVTSGRSSFPLVTMAQALGWPEGVWVNSRGDRKTPGGNVFSADLPAPSLTGNGFRSWYRTDLGNPAGMLAPEQGGLLQGFPLTYSWRGSRTSRSQRVADTVSPLVGAAVLGVATGRPWEDAVRTRIRDLYGEVPARPQPAEQMDLLAEAAA